MGHRLLAIDILASGDGIEHHADVPVVRRRDQHRVNVIPLQNAPIVLEALGSLVGSLDALGQVRLVDIADRGNRRAQFPERRHHASAAPAGTDQGNRDSVIGTRGGGREQ